MGYTLKRHKSAMRVVSDDSREVIATDEEITNASQLQTLSLRNVHHLNVSVGAIFISIADVEAKHSSIESHQFNALTSLHSLETATQLRNLNVSHNALTSLRGVEELTQLRRLRCHCNQIADLSWLASLPHLQELWVHENQVEMAQILHLASVPTLQTLILHPNPCTNTPNFVAYVVKTLPWLSRLDRTEVDEPLRQQSQHVDEREFLSSAATDVSEISLMTNRSDSSAIKLKDKSSNETETMVTSLSATTTPLATSSSSSSVDVIVLQKKTKKPKMTAEDFMRAFPVQDFIPASACPPLTEVSSTLEPVVWQEPHASTNEPMSNQHEDERALSTETTRPQRTTSQPGSVPLSTPLSVSAIASAVMALPVFDGDSLLSQKKKPVLSKAKTSKKKGSAKSVTTGSTRPSDPALAAFQQREWTLAYPNSTVHAIQIRSDGSALAKWPNGSVAVSIDRERDGFRCYAAHQDGTIALSFDADGVGFINYYPSGRMMISTSSSGDGLYFSSDGSAILRQWDAQLTMKNDKCETTDKLSDDTSDGALVSKLSDGLGVRFELQRPADHMTRPSAIRLQICFAGGFPGFRHAFSNWLNVSEPNGDLCDAVLGKEPAKLRRQATLAPVPTHSDTLQGIRAAVAKLGSLERI